METKVVATTRVKIQDALSWELHSKSLNEALTDHAEEELGLAEVECTVCITTDGEDFVLTVSEF